jgi:hypothetical protein
MDLSFLSNVELLSADEAKAKKASSIGARKERNPVDADLRLFKDGSIYPSSALVTEFNLEYTNKDVEVAGNGFDVFSSNDFKQLGALPKAVAFLATVVKSAPKVDLFGRCTWDAEGKPNSLVGDQGSPTFGKNSLLPMLEEVYNFSFDNNPDLAFIDLNIVREYKLKTPSGVALIPKKISKGETAGQLTTERRENQEYMPLVIATEFSTSNLPNPVSEVADSESEPIENMVVGVDAVTAAGELNGSEISHEGIEVHSLADLDEESFPGRGNDDDDDLFGI